MAISFMYVASYAEQEISYAMYAYTCACSVILIASYIDVTYTLH